MVRPAAHSFPHRGSPSTSHTRVRWQPYHASLQSIPPRSSPLAYFVTPASSTSSISPSPRSFSEPDRTRHVPNLPREAKLRDFQKSKFALNLVDQAVKSLCDIWPQQDIPTVFLTSGRPMITPMSGSDHPRASNVLHPASRNTHLPSPISPTTQPTPTISPVASYPVQPVMRPQLPQCDTAPMKGFVHEVLRRSRTSGSVLQTALCYLEAIRSKIPDLVRKEKQGFSSFPPVASDDDRMSQGEVGIECETDLGISVFSTNGSSSDDQLATARIHPISNEVDVSLLMVPDHDADNTSAPKSETVNASLPPLPPLPSPLLCPRRTFLASLILASKFMQDRCYSNRAWAKLSGLPPREIGRCERALGEALEWRLWVGKLPAAQSASGRTLTKSKSESDISFPDQPPMVHDTDPLPASGSKATSLRRSATLPPGSLYLDGPRVNGIDNTSPTTYSSPSTPGLSYSPTPTESSLGDRTVQMTSFMDVCTPPPGQFATFIGAQNDKALATLSVPSNALFVFTNSRDTTLPSVPQRVESHYLVSHGIVGSNSVWTSNDDV